MAKYTTETTTAAVASKLEMADTAAQFMTFSPLILRTADVMTSAIPIWSKDNRFSASFPGNDALRFWFGMRANVLLCLRLAHCRLSGHNPNMSAFGVEADVIFGDENVAD